MIWVHEPMKCYCRVGGIQSHTIAPAPGCNFPHRVTQRLENANAYADLGRLSMKPRRPPERNDPLNKRLTKVSTGTGSRHYNSRTAHDTQRMVLIERLCFGHNRFVYFLRNNNILAELRGGRWVAS